MKQVRVKPNNTSGINDMPGDPAAKFSVAETALRSLHHNRIVYRERFIAVVESSDLSFDERGIRGNVKPVHMLFMPFYVKLSRIKKGWHFSGTWDYTMLSWTETGYLRITAPWFGWKIWPEVELLKKIGAFAEKGEMQSALSLLGPSMFEI